MRFFLLISALAAASPCFAQTAPAPAELQRGLEGHWKGSLQYKDYRSGNLVDLPVTCDIRALADAATVISVSAFDDGPKAGTVFITDVSLFDPKSDRVQSASFRRKNPVEVHTSQVDVADFADPDHWSVTLVREGSDGGRPAQIRTTQTRNGASLKSLEEYRAPGAADAPWNFRNQTILSRN